MDLPSAAQAILFAPLGPIGQRLSFAAAVVDQEDLGFCIFAIGPSAVGEKRDPASIRRPARTAFTFRSVCQLNGVACNRIRSPNVADLLIRLPIRCGQYIK